MVPIYYLILLIVNLHKYKFQFWTETFKRKYKNNYEQLWIIMKHHDKGRKCS